MKLPIHKERPGFRGGLLGALGTGRAHKGLSRSALLAVTTAEGSGLGKCWLSGPPPGRGPGGFAILPALLQERYQLGVRDPGHTRGVVGTLYDKALRDKGLCHTAQAPSTFITKSTPRSCPQPPSGGHLRLVLAGVLGEPHSQCQS